jgi:hypothetical protein
VRAEIQREHILYRENTFYTDNRDTLDGIDAFIYGVRAEPAATMNEAPALPEANTLTMYTYIRESVVYRVYIH